MQLPDDHAGHLPDPGPRTRHATYTQNAGDGRVLGCADGSFRAAFDLAPAPLALIGGDGRFLHVNPALRDLLGYDPSDLSARDLRSLSHPDDRAGIDQLLQRFNEAPAGTLKNSTRLAAGILQLDARLQHRSGREISAIVNFSPARDGCGNLLHFVSHVRDVTTERRAERLELERRQVLEMVAGDQPLSGVLIRLSQLIERQIPGAHGGILLLQDGVIRLFCADLPGELVTAIRRRPISFAAGLGAGRISGDTPRVADVDTDPAWNGLRDAARAEGVACCWAVTLCTGDGLPVGFVVAFCRESRQPTAEEQGVLETALRLAMIAFEHHQTTRQLAHLVHHDSLTGLPNRILFEDRLQHAVALARRTKSSFGLMAMDLNRFKQINDTLGHHAGDALLQQFAKRLYDTLRESDTLARTGGDEFVLIAQNIRGREEAEMIAARMRERLAATPFDLAGQRVPVMASIGVAMYPDDANDAETLQHAADAAMYRVKEAGRSEAVVA